MPGTCPCCGSYNMRHGLLFGTVWCDDCEAVIESNAEPFDDQEEHEDENSPAETARSDQHS